MTRNCIREYAAALRGRYFEAGKREKSALVSEFCRTTGYDRKSAIRLLGHTPEAPKKRRGWGKAYGSEVTRALRVAWEATGHIGSKRLAPFLAELIPSLERQHELVVSTEVRAQVVRISAATIDRLLKPFRRKGLRRPYNSARSHSMLKGKIPICTFADSNDAGVGYEVALPGGAGSNQRRSRSSRARARSARSSRLPGGPRRPS